MPLLLAERPSIGHRFVDRTTEKHLRETARDLLLLLGWILAIERRTRARGPHEQLLAIRERDVPAVRSTDRPAGGVYGPEPLHHDLHARLHGGFGEAASDQTRRGSAFDRPLLHLPVRLLHIEVEPRMRVDPFQLGDRALDRHLVACIEFRRKSMMRLHPPGGEDYQ